MEICACLAQFLDWAVSAASLTSSTEREQEKMVWIEVKLSNEILAITLAEAVDMINTRPLKGLWQDLGEGEA